MKQKLIHESSRLKKQQINQEKELTESLQQLENSYTNAVTKKEKDKIKRELKQLDEKKNRGVYVRSRVTDIEYNEKYNKLFFDSLREKERKQRMESIETAEGIITEPTKILKEVEKFYKNLYTEEPEDPQSMQAILSNLDKTVSTEQNRKLTQWVNREEVWEALMAMNKNKSPGSDGLPVEYYLAMWPEIADDLTEMINNTRLANTLSQSQKEAITSLLYKKNEKTQTQELEAH